MFPFDLVRWLRSPSRSRVKTHVKKPRFRLVMEELETRLAPATTFTWKGTGADANWATGSNWSNNNPVLGPNVAPNGLADGTGAYANIVFPGSAPQKTTVNNLTGATFNSIVFQGPGYKINPFGTAAENAITLGDPSVSGSGFIIANAPAVGEVIAVDLIIGGAAGSKQSFTIHGGADLTITGEISGGDLDTVGIGNGFAPVELNKTLQGTLFLSADNSAFVGSISIDPNAGIIQITHAKALGDSLAGTTVGVGSQLQINIPGTTPASAHLIDEPLLIGGDGFTDGALLNVAGTNRWSGIVQMETDTTFGVAAGSTLNISGQVSDQGGIFNFTKEGQGTLRLSTFNIYRGLTNINDGVLRVEAGSTTALVNGVPTTVSALGTADGTAATGTIVNTIYVSGAPFHVGSLQISDPDVDGDTPVTIVNEMLDLNGSGFGGAGSLQNINGYNTWTGIVNLHPPAGANPNSVIISTLIGTTDPISTLTITGLIQDPFGSASLRKNGTGTLILPNANTYRGSTTIAAGTLVILDSRALGAVGGSTTVFNAATLELRIDGLPDSVTGTTNTLDISDPITITGRGTNSQGALYSNTGINIYSGNINISGGAYIGVNRDPNPTNSINYYTDDYSLTIARGAVGNLIGSTLLTKVGAGHLILPNANNSFTGNMNIATGWVTAENNNSLGQTLPNTSQNNQRTVTVEDGAALHLRPDGAANLTMPQNFVLSGFGIDHPFESTTSVGGIDELGVLVNLVGMNTIPGNVALSGAVGVGVEHVFGKSQLYLTGYISEIIPVFNIAPVSGGGGVPEVVSNYNLQTNSGIFVLSADVYSVRDEIQIYAGRFTSTIGDPAHINPPSPPPNATLLYDSTTNGDPYTPTSRFAADITIDYSLTQATATAVMTTGTGWNVGPVVTDLTGKWTDKFFTVVVNPGGNSRGTQWDYTVTITPDAIPSGGLTKLGSKLLVVTADGTYKGDIDIKEGVWLNENNTGLGGATGKVTVQPGAALLLGNQDPAHNSNVLLGSQIWGEHLILNGPGNTTLGPTYNLTGGPHLSAFTVLDDTVVPKLAFAAAPDQITDADHSWRGPITLNTSIAIDVPTGSRLNIVGTIDDASNTYAPVLNTVTASVSGSVAEDAQVIDAGPGASGLLTINADADANADDFRVYLGDFENSPATAILVYDSTTNGDFLNPTNLGAAVITIAYDNGVATASAIQAGSGWELGPIVTNYASLPSTMVTIVVNQGDSSQLSTTWNYTATLVAKGPQPGSDLIKVHGGDLILSGANTYRGVTYVGTSATDNPDIGGVTVNDFLNAGNPLNGGIVTVANSTGLGTASSGTIVQDGNALQVQGNLTIAGESLVLMGTGVSSVPAKLPETWHNLGSSPIGDGLTLSGGSTINVGGTASGGTAEDVQVIDVGSSTALLTFIGDAYGIEDNFRLYLGDFATNGMAGCYLWYDSSGDFSSTNPTPTNNGQSQVVVDYTATGATITVTTIVDNGSDWYLKDSGTTLTYSTPAAPTFLSIVVNQGGGLSGTAWDYTAAIDVSGTTVITPTTGRITGIATDPLDQTTVYVSTSDGGVWKTSNDGQTWSPHFDAQPGTPMFTGAIARAGAANPLTYYLGTGEANNSADSFYGTGVYKTTDGGKTWTLLSGSSGVPNPFAGKAISRIAVDPTNTNRIYVADSDMETNGTVGTNTIPVGVWRWAPGATPTTGTWSCLTNTTSDLRDGSLPGSNNGFPTYDTGENFFPEVAGPDDNFFLAFPQKNAVYSDVWISNGVLYMAIGTPNGGGFTPDFPNNPTPFQNGPINDTIVYPNGVYRLNNPSTVNSTSNKPQWFVGDGNPVDGSGVTQYTNGGGAPFTTGFVAAFQDTGAGQNSPNSPVDGTNRNGNVKFATFLNRIVAAVSDPNGNLLEIQESTDGGVNWAQIGTPGANGLTDYMSGFGGYSSAILVNAAAVYAGGANGVFSYIGGVWTDISTDANGGAPAGHAHTMQFDIQGRVVVGTDGGVFRFDETTDLWTNLNGNLLAITSFASVGMGASDGNAIIGAAQGNGLTGLQNLPVTINGNAETVTSQNWKSLANSVGTPVLNNASLVRIDPENRANVYAIFNGDLYKSTNGGASGSFNLLRAGVRDFAIDPVNTSRIVINGGFQSFNGGVSFSATPLGGTGAHVAVAGYQGKFQVDPGFNSGAGLVTDQGSNAYDPKTVYFASASLTNANITVTKNGGITAVTRNTLPAASRNNIADLIVDPANRDTIYVVRNVFGGGKVFKSTDAGQTWTDLTGTGVTGLPDVPVWCITLDPRNGDLYIGTDRGVYRSIGGGANWRPYANSSTAVPFGDGLPNVQVRDINLDQALNTLTIATYGRSIYQLYINNESANAGGLRAVSGSTVWTGTVQLAGDTLIRVDGIQTLQNGVSAARLEIAGAISDLSSTSNNLLTKVGGGFLVLSGANTYTGVTDIQEGVVIAKNPDALGAPVNNSVQTLTVLGASGTFTLAYDSVPTGSLDVLSPTLAADIEAALNGLPGIGALGVTVSGPVGNVYTVTFNSSLAGSALLGITVPTSDPGVSVTVAATGDASTIVRPGMALWLESDLELEPVYLNGDGIAFDDHNTGALRNKNNNTFTGTLILSTDSTIGVDSGSSLTIGTKASLLGTGTITNGSTGHNLVKELTGTLILSSANSFGGAPFLLDVIGSGGVPSTLFDGGMVVSRGIVSVRHDDALGVDGNTTTVLDGAQLQMQGGITVDANQNLRLTGSGISGSGVLQNVSGANTWQGPVLLARDGAFNPATTPLDNSTITIGVLMTKAGDKLTIDGAIDDGTNTLNLTKVDAGTLVLNSNTSSYDGVTTVANGILRIQQGHALGDSTNTTVVQNNAALQLDGNGSNFTVVNEGVLLNGSGAAEVQTVTIPIGTTSGTFRLTFTHPNGTTATTSTAGLAFNASATTVQNALNGLSNIGSLGGTATVQKLGNVYTITFGGTLAGRNLAPLTIFGANTAGASISTLRDGAAALHNLSGDNIWQLASPNPAITLESGSTIGAEAGTSLTVDGLVTAASLLVGSTDMSPNITKLGAGTLTFLSNNTYTGATFVNDGVLNIRDAGALGSVANEVQVVTITGSLGGFFKLKFNNGTIESETGDLSSNYTVTNPNFITDVTNALNGLASVAGGTVTVAFSPTPGTPNSVFTVTFNGGKFINKDQIEMTGTATGGVIIAVATVTDGAQGTIVADGATLQVQNNITQTTEYLTINGHGFNGLGALQNTGGTNTWDMPILLGKNDTWIGAVASSTLIISEPITDEPIGAGVNDFALGKVGGGTVQFTGAASNDYTGTTTVLDGTLELNMTGSALAILRDLVVGDDVATAGTAIARWLGDNQMVSTRSVTVNSDGHVNLNNRSQTIAALTIKEGSATTGASAGALTVSGLIDLTGATLTTNGTINVLGSVKATAGASDPALIDGTGILALGAATRTFNVSSSSASEPVDLVITAQITGTAGLTKTGNGNLEIDSNANAFGDVHLLAGTLSGEGTVGRIVGAGSAAAVGTVNPGTTAPGILTAQDDVTMGTSTTFWVDLDYIGSHDPDFNSTTPPPAPVPGTDHDQLLVNGDVQIDSALLSGTVGNNVAIDDVFTILRVTGGNSLLIGQLATLIDGVPTRISDLAYVYIDGKTFQIDYTYGVDGSIVLRRSLNVVNSFVITSSTQVASDPLHTASSVYGQTVIFTATVVLQPGATLPSGASINFTLDNGVPYSSQLVPLPVATGQVNWDPQATGVYNFTMPVGTHIVSADLIDPSNTIDLSFNVPAPNFTQTVNRGPVTVAIEYSVANGPWVSSATPVYGQEVRARATVTPNLSPQTPNANMFPTGNVTFFLDPSPGTDLTGGGATGTGIVDSFGHSPIITLPSNVPFGNHVIRVQYIGDSLNSYAGDANYARSAVTDFPLTIVRDSADVTFVSTTSPSDLGQLASFNVKVVPVATGSTGIPQGTVKLYDGAVSSAALKDTQTLDASGAANLTTTTLGVGSHTMFVVFEPSDLNFLTDTSSIGYVVNKAPTKVTFIAPTTLSSNYGTPVTFTVDVAPDPIITGFGAFSGTVDFWVDGVVAGPGVVYLGQDTITVNSSGQYQATFTTNSTQLLGGTHQIFAVFGGNANFAESTGTINLFTVNARATVATVISASPSSNAGVYGQTTTFNATVTAPGFTGSVNGGQVIFYDTIFGGELGRGNVVNGAASFTTGAAQRLTAATHIITATYDPSAGTATTNFNGDNSSPFNYIVKKASVTVGVTGTPTIGTVPTYGIPITFTATINTSNPGSGPPTNGTVDFYNGPINPGNHIGTGVFVAPNTYEITTQATELTIGLHTINAVFAGDDNLVAKNGVLNGFQVTSAATETVLDTIVGTFFYGEAISFTATVTSPSGLIPVGATVSFIDSTNSRTLGTGTVDNSGNAFFNYTYTTPALALTAGDHDINAVVSPITNFAGSTSASSNPVSTQSVTVVAANTTVNLVSNSSLTGPDAYTSASGAAVTFTANVTFPTNPPSTTPTGPVNAGSVTFFIDGAPASNGTVNLNSNGVATYTSSTLPQGAHQIKAVYNAPASNSNFAGLSQDVLTQTVLKANTINVVANPTSPFYGNSTDLTISVTSSSSPTPTGTVDVYLDGNLYASGIDISSGPVNVPIAAVDLPAGVRTIQIHYSGDTVYTANDKTISLTVQPATTQTTLQGSGSPSGAGQTVTFTAMVEATSVNAPGNPLTGSVTLYRNGNAIQTLNLDGVNNFINFDVSNLPVGNNTITAKYIGTTEYAASAASNAVSQQVVASATLSNLTGPATWSEGAPGYSATITIQNGVAPFTVDDFNLPAGLVASLNNRTITISGTPTTAGTYNNIHFDVLAANGILATPKTFTITIKQAPTIGTPNPTGTYKSTYSSTFAITGGIAPYSALTVTSGALPTGLTKTIFGSSIKILGTPLSVGTFTFGLQVKDSTGAIATGNFTIDIQKAAVTTKLTSSVPNPNVNQAVTLTATLTSPAGKPTSGNVTFYDADNGNAIVGTGTVNASGIAKSLPINLPRGSHTIFAIYDGNVNFAASTSNNLAQNVTNTKMTLTGSPLVAGVVTVTQGKTATFTVKITNLDFSLFGPPTGEVRFFLNGSTTPIKIVALTGNTATVTVVFSTMTLALGNHTITAKYVSDSPDIDSVDLGTVVKVKVNRKTGRSQ